MNSEPKIEDLSLKKLIGIRITTSLADDKTSLLWNRFMNLKGAIQNIQGDNLFSVQIYGENFMNGEFDTQSEFEKWAATEVHDYANIPKGMEKLEIPQGKYAVFIHEGTAKDFAKTSTYIFNEWLPNSKFILDNRPHFEVLGKDYKGPEDPDSREKIWIPVKGK